MTRMIVVIGMSALLSAAASAAERPAQTSYYLNAADAVRAIETGMKPKLYATGQEIPSMAERFDGLTPAPRPSSSPSPQPTSAPPIPPAAPIRYGTLKATVMHMTIEQNGQGDWLIHMEEMCRGVGGVPVYDVRQNDSYMIELGTPLKCTSQIPELGQVSVDVTGAAIFAQIGGDHGPAKFFVGGHTVRIKGTSTQTSYWDFISAGTRALTLDSLLFMVSPFRAYEMTSTPSEPKPFEPRGAKTRHHFTTSVEMIDGGPIP